MKEVTDSKANHPPVVKLPKTQDESRQLRQLNDFKIMIATPHSYETIHKQWFLAYEQLIKPDAHKLYMSPSLPLDVNRNETIKQALEDGTEYILFLDHDNIPDERMLVRLLEYGVPVVGSLYFERQYPHLPLIYTFEKDFKTVRVEYNYPKGLVQCDVIGMGCALFNTEVFRNLEEPWFCYDYKGFSWGTEDIGLFHKLKDHDISVFIDTKNTCGHLTTQVIDEGDWEYCKQGYLEQVRQQAEKLDTNTVFFDKTNGMLIRSPSADCNEQES